MWPNVFAISKLLRNIVFIVIGSHVKGLCTPAYLIGFEVRMNIRVACDHNFFRENQGYRLVLDVIPGADFESGHTNFVFEKF